MAKAEQTGKSRPRKDFLIESSLIVPPKPGLTPTFALRESPVWGKQRTRLRAALKAAGRGDSPVGPDKFG